MFWKGTSQSERCFYTRVISQHYKVEGHLSCCVRSGGGSLGAIHTRYLLMQPCGLKQVSQSQGEHGSIIKKKKTGEKRLFLIVAECY